MADLDLINKISWNLIDPPQEDAEIKDDNGNYRPLLPQEWQQVVLPGQNFIIEYPFARYNELDPEIPYETDRIPVTLLELLTTIYLFYQEPLPQDELNLIRQKASEEGDGDLYHDRPINRRIDVMYGLVEFEGVQQGTKRGTYLLNLGS